MNKIYFLLFLLPASLISFSQPLTGIKNIPGDYATITAAVAALNGQGVGAGGEVQKVNISFLPAGVYFLRTKDGESYKIIKL